MRQVTPVICVLQKGHSYTQSLFPPYSKIINLHQWRLPKSVKIFMELLRKWVLEAFSLKHMTYWPWCKFMSVENPSNFIRWHCAVLLFYTCIKSSITLREQFWDFCITRCCLMKSLEFWMLLKDSRCVHKCKI